MHNEKSDMLQAVAYDFHQKVDFLQIGKFHSPVRRLFLHVHNRYPLKQLVTVLLNTVLNLIGNDLFLVPHRMKVLMLYFEQSCRDCDCGLSNGVKSILSLSWYWKMLRSTFFGMGQGRNVLIESGIRIHGRCIIIIA